MYGVLFDIDGTLLQTGGAGKHAFAAAFAELFQVTEFSNNVPFAGRSDRAIVRDLMNLHDIESSTENWQRFENAYLKHLEVTLTQCDGEVLPGVIALLDTLQGVQHALPGILTGNTKAGAERKLKHYQLADRFDFGGFGDVSTSRDDIAQEAKEQAQAHASRDLTGVMVIGDTVHDVQCAQSINAFAVAVATGGATIDELAASGPDLLIEDLTDTEALLAEIMTAAPSAIDATTRS